MLNLPGKTRSMFRLADEVIAVNQLIGDEASKDNPSVTVIPNFVDVDAYRPAEQRDEAGPARSSGPAATALRPTSRRSHRRCDDSRPIVT